MKSFYILLLFALFSVCSYGQVVIRVITTDISSTDLITQVTVHHSINSTEQTPVFSNVRGEAFINAAIGDSVDFELGHLAYAPAKKSIVIKGKPGDTLTIPFKLKYVNTQTLRDVIVRPIGVPKTVFSSEEVSVDDFEFLQDGRMVLLTYEKTKKKGTELFLYDGKRVLAQIPVAENGQELIRDFRGNPHVVTDKKVYGITADQALLFLGEIDKAYYMSYVAPIVDTTLTKYFFSNYNPDYPAFEYFSFSDEDTAYRKIASIEDDLMMELYRSEYKWVDVRTKIWAKDMEHKTGIDAEIWVGANYFTQSVYYKELYAPMFERNDTVFVFDHYKNMILRFDEDGEAIDSIPIFYHLQAKQNGWKKKLIQDQITGEVYSVYENAGRTMLKRIDLSTGETRESIPVHHKYADKFLIRGNKVYYTYRPFESAQKKFLYEEVLPVFFPEADILHGDPVSRN